MCRHLRDSQSGPFPSVPPSVGWLAPSVHSDRDRASLLIGVLAVGSFLFPTAGSWVCIKGTAAWFRTSVSLHNGNSVRSFKQMIPLYWICCEISRPQVISGFLGTVNYSFTKSLTEFQREQNETVYLLMYIGILHCSLPDTILSEPPESPPLVNPQVWG